jgi:arylsulfatase A-like enzyme
VFYGAEVIEDGRIRKEPGYLTDFWTDHSVRFIERNKNKSFFLFLPYNGPYGLGGSLLKPARNRHAAYYADKAMISFPREPVHEYLRYNRDYINNVQAMRRFAAELSGVDDGVGHIMNTLKRLGLDDNTLVIFTADQGWSGGHNGVWGMGDHTMPCLTFDKTIHIPLVCRHPGRIPSGRRSDIMVSNYDLLPTVLSYLGLADKMPGQPESPGRDYSAVLRGKQIKWDNVIFYEAEYTRMIRTAEWKYTCRYPSGPNELYHLANDPTERINLVFVPEYNEMRKQLTKRLNEFFNRYADSKYDLWRGGGSKSHLMSRPKQPLLRPASKQTAP